MPVPTHVRSFLTTQLLAAFQSAKGTIATVFTGGGAAGLWTTAVRLPASHQLPDDEWMTEDSVENVASRYRIGEALKGAIVCHATPASVEWLLRNNYGPLAAGVFSLEAQVQATQWLTLAWVENVTAGATEQLVRLRDVWFHRLQFSVRRDGILAIRGDFAARLCAPTALNAGGVTLPAAPMMPADLNTFDCRSYALVRDPAGLNVSLRIASVDVILEHGLRHEWDMFAGLWDVHKAGKLRASLRFEAEVADETWAILTDARAGTGRRFTLTLTAVSPAKTLTFDFEDLAFEFEELGHDEQRHVRNFRAIARAHKNGTDFLTIGLA